MFPLVLTALAVAFTSAQEPAPIAAEPEQAIEGARPVAAAVARLARELGWNITYEDPPFINGKELRDLTVKVIDGRHIFVPKGGRVLLPDNLDAVAATEDPVALLESIVATEQSETGTIKRFKVFRSASRFHVVPTKFLDQQGRWRMLTPVLDTPVRLSHGEVNLLEFMDVLCHSITAANGATVKAGRVPVNLGLRTRLPRRTREGPARELLLETIESLPQALAWLLYYDPSVGTYYLHIVPPGTH